MKNIALLSLVICFQFYAFNQTVSKNIQLPKAKTSNYLYAQVEPSLALNTINTNEIAIGTVMDDYYFTKDGGLTWTSKTLKSKYGVGGDPVLMFDKHGFLYYTHLSNYKKGAYLDRIVCQQNKKIDGKWSKGSFPKPNSPKAQDKQWLAYSHTRDELYMTWTEFDQYDSKNSQDSSRIVFSSSSNRGKSWSDPIRISSNQGDCLDGDNTIEGAFPCVGPNNELYVVFARAGGLFLQKSSDNGKSWLKKDKLIHEQVGGWDLKVPGILRCNGFPILQCDTSSGPHRGRLYLNWADQRNGEDNTDSWLSYSDDQGETWSAPTKVNQDESKRHQFFTWMTLDQTTGFIYVLYFDRRNHKDHSTDVYLSYSKDGGKTFKDIKVSEKSFIPNDKVFFGDYINVQAHAGIVACTWPVMNQGKISLWFAKVTF